MRARATQNTKMQFLPADLLLQYYDGMACLQR